MSGWSSSPVGDLIDSMYAKPRFVNGWSAFSGTAAVADIGTWEFVTEVDSSSSNGETNEGHYFAQTSAASSGYEMFAVTGDEVSNRGMKFSTVAIQSLTVLTNFRFFIGYARQPVTENTVSDVLSADDPADAHLFGFQKRAADSVWFACTRNGSTLSRVNTGVTVTTDVVKFLWHSDGSGVLKWAIRNFANEDLGAGVHSAYLPGETTNMKFMSGLETTAAEAKVIRHYRAREYTE